MRLNKPLPTLTRRETQVALLIAEGLPDKEIAARIKSDEGKPISPHTIRHYIHTLFLKLEVDSRELVIVWVFRSGMGASARPLVRNSQSKLAR